MMEKFAGILSGWAIPFTNLRCLATAGDLMPSKIEGTWAGLNPQKTAVTFKPDTETALDNSINQIMEQVNSRNKLSQEVQMLRAMVDSLREMANLVDKGKANLRSIMDVMDQLGMMLSQKAEGLNTSLLIVFCSLSMLLVKTSDIFFN